MSSTARSVRGHLLRAAFAWLLAGVALGILASPVTASQGPARYIYEVCDSALPGGNTAGVKFVGSAENLTLNNTCATPNGSLGISDAKPASPGYSYWSVPIPPPAGGRIESLTLSAEACGRVPGSTIFDYEPGWPTNCTGESQRTFYLSSKSSPLNASIYLGCNSSCASGDFVYAHYLAATEVDPVAPRLAALAGSLLSGKTLRGHEGLSAEATDEGGGLTEVEALVNGQPVGQPYAPHCNIAQVANPSVVGTVASSVPPCPSAIKAGWTLDTAAYPFQEGSNSVQVCASDFASLSQPNTGCSGAQTVNVDNSCTESPVGGGEVLSAGFAGSHDEEVTVPFEHSARVDGTLADREGGAIRGATICVQMQTPGVDRELVPVATTTTDAQGHFSYRVPPGPNRRVLVGYRHDTFQLAKSMRYFAHAKPTLRLKPGRVSSGGRIRIVGKVPEPQAAGCVVVLQASALNSSRWFTFHRATANDRGVFHSSYRFDATRSTTTYRIRAVVPRQGGYPWEVGHSKPALVQVRVSP